LAGAGIMVTVAVICGNLGVEVEAKSKLVK
jgi:hypothetical protein